MEGATAAPGPDLAFDVQMMGGAALRLHVPAGGRVAELRRAFLAVKPCPPDKAVRLMQGSSILKDADPVAALGAGSVMAVLTTPESSYLAEKDGEVRLISEGDADFHEDLVKRAQVSQDAWVPPHPDHPESRNLATVSEGASASASSNLWGTGLVPQEKLDNVLRLGSLHGNPRFVGGDNSFIFAENQPKQVLTVDLGKDCMVARIGAMCYGDRWLCSFKVRTHTGSADESLEWGSDEEYRRHGGVVYFDREPTLVRTIIMECKSGHYHGAGARLGPVFAYGCVAETAPGRDA